jgi:hypothetical protein
MISKTGLAWDSELMFTRFIEDCGVQCELITPHMLAAPFYRGRFVSLVIPTGFGNMRFSSLLPALRASSRRIQKYVENGGNLLVFGAMDARKDSYDWLPVNIEYVHEYFSTSVNLEKAHPHCSILEDFSADEIDCDGYFSEYEGDVIARSGDDRALMVGSAVGEGTVIVTSFHEYPSRAFIRAFCSHERETLF